VSGARTAGVLRRRDVAGEGTLELVENSSLVVTEHDGLPTVAPSRCTARDADG
jgi:hypothetical protein